MLTEYKTDRHHFFRDAKGRLQGEYKSWHSNGNMCEHCFYVDSLWHGESRVWHDDGTLEWRQFWVNNELYRNLIENPVDKKDKFLITLETGGMWIC